MSETMGWMVTQADDLILLQLVKLWSFIISVMVQPKIALQNAIDVYSINISQTLGPGLVVKETVSAFCGI